MKTFGLIGRKLGHSFSKKYFEEKFRKEGITDARYELFELSDIGEFPELLRENTLCGLNVTIPYKQQVMTFLDEIEETARRIGAVNVIRIDRDCIRGFNTDYTGFRHSLSNWIQEDVGTALVLGNGGAARAVKVALEDLHISFKVVSRSSGDLHYGELAQHPEVIASHKLIVNTTPLGMSPETETFPQIPYAGIGKGHFLYDLVYNPEVTEFMKRGAKQGAEVKNGMEMLTRQADAAWDLWNRNAQQ